MLMRAIVLPECLGLSVIFEDSIFCDFRDSTAECVCTERSWLLRLDEMMGLKPGLLAMGKNIGDV